MLRNLDGDAYIYVSELYDSIVAVGFAIIPGNRKSLECLHYLCHCVLCSLQLLILFTQGPKDFSCGLKVFISTSHLLSFLDGEDRHLVLAMLRAVSNICLEFGSWLGTFIIAMPLMKSSSRPSTNW
ncbi:hypothetical protein EV356DRAFT_91476 [Viridothelium virens]|uniref:Uncharacterized protein n=1 Tax=Viridothelium virens TaxID=1048519 RepID=A0A6A6HD82_VIRVR|nr:hypothetical protein EV356DRAFT_91476 [Viridothelium virens]